MAIIIIRESDLDNNTIKVVDKKVTVPGAEIEVLDKFEVQDTDTHYVTKESKYLKHVETGAVWPATIAVMHERGATETEHFTVTPSVTFGNSGLICWFETTATSAVDGLTYMKQLGTFSLSDYVDAKDFNEKHAGQKLQFTVEDRFSDKDGKPKVLGTTVELDYPQLPYKEGTSKATLVVDDNPNLHITYDDPLISDAAYGVTKTVHYKLHTYSGKVFDGTKTFIGNSVTGETLANDIDYSSSNIWKVEYAVDPFHVSSFFSNVTVTAQSVTKEIGDHL